MAVFVSPDLVKADTAYRLSSIVLPLTSQPSSMGLIDSLLHRFLSLANLRFGCVEQVFEPGEALEKQFSDLFLVLPHHCILSRCSDRETAPIIARSTCQSTPGNLEPLTVNTALL